MEKKARKNTTKKASTEKKVDNDSVFKQTYKPKTYLSFGKRVLINTVLFVVSLILCFAVASKTIEREKTTPINYTDVNQISYKVYLKENDYYHDKYLDMNRAYVASLIDYIDIDFNYIFDIAKITKMKFDYKIIAQLVIENSNGINYIDEEYVLKDNEQKELDSSGTLNIFKNIKIDYGYYNQLANRFKNETGVDTNSYLNVYLQVDKQNTEKLNYTIKEITKSNIKIPLSERAIEINLDSSNSETTKQVVPIGKVIFDPMYLVLEILSFFITCVFLYKIIKYLSSLIKIKTPYDKYVNKILKNYDRLIVETRNDLDMSECKIIDVKSFNELLDVRDNLKLPIIYNILVKHEKGLFYVKNENDVYRYVVKNVDLNNK